MLESLFPSLSPGQRQLAMAAVLPVAFLVGSKVINRGAPKPTTTIPAQAAVANDAAVGAGQLAGFESAWSDALGSGLDDIWSAINSWQAPAAASSTPVVATNPQPTTTTPQAAVAASPGPSAILWPEQYPGNIQSPTRVGLVDLVNPTTGAVITNLTPAEAARYSGYNQVPGGTAKIPTGGV